MWIGITGHQSLEQRLRDKAATHSEAQAWNWVEQAFADLLADSSPADTIVISSLAAGADQRLSKFALKHGGQIEVIVPSLGIITTFDESDRSGYEQLIAQAVEVIKLDYPEPSEEAYFAAGKAMVDRADTIVAVWDGEEAEGLGGTGDIVAYALDCGRSVLQLDPIRRTSTQLSDKE